MATEKPAERGPSRPWRGVSADDRRAARRQQLVEAALDLLDAPSAPPRLAVGDVCARAELHKRYFYESFDSVTELLDAVIEDAMRRVLDRIDLYLERATEPSAYMRAALGGILDAMNEDPRLARVLLIEPMHPGTAFKPYREELLHRAMEQAALHGAFAPERLAGDELAVVLHAGHGATAELITAWCDGAIPAGRDRFLDLLVATVMRLLDAPGEER